MVVTDDGTLPLPWLAEPLAQALAAQRGHALLVHAAAGNGALPFALCLAQGWLCEQQSAGPREAPCGRCGSCRLVQSRTHPDLRVLLPEADRFRHGWPLAGDKAEGEGDDEGRGKRKPSRQVRIDEVRASIDWVMKTSGRGRGKVLLVHPAEAMNLQASSALLKTLEEPPAGTRLLLATGQPDAILPTVRSRCQRLCLPAPRLDEALRWLQAQGVPDAEVLLAAAEGRPLEALGLHADGVSARAWQELPRAVAAGRSDGLAGWPVSRVLDALLKLCHDVALCSTGAAARYFPPESLPPAPALGRVLQWHRTLRHAARHAGHPWNEPLLIDAMVAAGRDALGTR